MHQEVDPTLEEALSGPHEKEWRKAMKTEFEALTKQGVWTLERRPKYKNVVGCKWVLKTKYNADGSVERRKARLVARGFIQKFGEDYTETFAPIGRMSSIRLLIALSVEYGLRLYHLDVVMAYINGNLNEEIYMEQAEGFVEPNKEEMVYKLNKAIYGLKQSGRQWSEALDISLRKCGLKRMNADRCVYMLRAKNSVLIVLAYVDDLIVATNSDELFNSLKDCLSREFEFRDLEALSYCLGIEFKRNESTGSITMVQEKYARDVLKKHGMEDTKPVATPLDGNLKLSKCTEEDQIDVTMYKSLIGSLMYLCVATRPDISHAVSKLSQYNSDPRQSHWVAAKRVLRYVQGTLSMGLVHKKTGDPLVGFVDADWGGDLDDRLSYTGLMMRLAGAAVSWESRKQRSVALSSSESEYVALSEIAKETVYMRNFLQELNFMRENEPATHIFCDNQGAQNLVRNPVHHARTKHIHIRNHYVREVFERGEINITYVSSENNVADVLTKGLFAPAHRRCRLGLGLKSEITRAEGGCCD